MDVHPDREPASQIEELTEEARQLKALLLPMFILPPEWKLTRQETDVVRLLVGRPFVTAEMASPFAVRSTFTVVLFRVRQKLKQIGVTIKNERDRGWYIETWEKEIILGASEQWLKNHDVAELNRFIEAAELFRQFAEKIDSDQLDRLSKVLKYIKRML